MDQLSFIKLKFFCVFGEYFIGIAIIYLLVLFLLLVSNVYGILVQKILSEIIGFTLIFVCFLILKEKTQNFCFIHEPIYIWFNKFVIFDLFSKTTKFVVCFFLVIYFFVISDFVKNYKLTYFEYLLLLLFCALGLILLCSANDFVLIFLSIELISLTSYLLASFKKLSSYSLESGLKYLIVGAVSSSFFLLGSSFIYAYTGSITLIDIKFLLMNSCKFLIFSYDSVFFSEPLFLIKSFFYFNLLEKPIFLYKFYCFFIEIGMIFVIFSVFIKLALAPFHFWSLDVYEGSPSVSTFFFSTLTKISFFVFLSRFCFSFYCELSQFWVFLNLIVGFLSVIFGSFGGVLQKKLKTLLAYSSISHMGYSLLAFSNFSILGLEILYFYLFTYVLANIIIWCVILGLKIKNNYKNKLTKDIGDFVLLSKSNSFLAFSIAISFFSLAGIPPLLGFITKLNVFLMLVLQKFNFIALLIILCGVVSTFYYLRLIKILYFENLTVGKLYLFQFNNVFIFSILVFCLIFLFINPTLFFLFINKMIFFENTVNQLDFFQSQIDFFICTNSNVKLILKLIWF